MRRVGDLSVGVHTRHPGAPGAGRDSGRWEVSGSRPGAARRPTVPRGAPYHAGRSSLSGGGATEPGGADPPYPPEVPSQGGAAPRTPRPLRPSKGRRAPAIFARVTPLSPGERGSRRPWSGSPPPLPSPRLEHQGHFPAHRSWVRTAFPCKPFFWTLDSLARSLCASRVTSPTRWARTWAHSRRSLACCSPWGHAESLTRLGN